MAYPKGTSYGAQRTQGFAKEAKNFRFVTSLMLFVGGKRNISYFFIGEFFVFAHFR